MPAHDFEATEAEEEGAIRHWLRNNKQVGETTRPEDAPDDNGRPQQIGELETLETDALIFALGKDVDTAFMERTPGVEIGCYGVVRVDEQMITGRPRHSRARTWCRLSAPQW